MKKNLLLLLIVLLPALCFAQKITSKVDDFTGEKVVTTSWEKVYSGGMTGKNQTHARLRHEGGNDFFEIRLFTDCVASCKKGEKILMKTDKGIVELLNTEYKLTGPGDWSPSSINSKLGIYLVCTSSNIAKLANEKVTKIRITLSDGYRDIELKDKDSSKLQNLVKAFLSNQ